MDKRFFLDKLFPAPAPGHQVGWWKKGARNQLPAKSTRSLPAKRRKDSQELHSSFWAGLSHSRSVVFQKWHCSWITPSPLSKMYIQIPNVGFGFSKRRFLRLFLWCLGTLSSPASTQRELLHYLKKQTPKLAPVRKTHSSAVQRNSLLPGLPSCWWAY